MTNDKSRKAVWNRKTIASGIGKHRHSGEKPNNKCYQGKERQEASGIGRNRHLLSNWWNYPHSSCALFGAIIWCNYLVQLSPFFLFSFLLAFPPWPELAVELAWIDGHCWAIGAIFRLLLNILPISLQSVVQLWIVQLKIVQSSRPAAAGVHGHPRGYKPPVAILPIFDYSVIGL